MYPSQKEPMDQSDDAKSTILAKIRVGKPDALPRPEMLDFASESPDLAGDFVRMAEIDHYIKEHFLLRYL